MPDIRPAQFPRTPRSQVRLYNLTATRRPALTFNMAGESITLRLGPATDPMPGNPMALTTGSGNAWLTLKPPLFDQWLQPWIGNETLSRLPPALRNAARHAALDPLLTALNITTGLAFDLTGSSAPLPESPAQLGLWLMEADTVADDVSAVLYLDEATAAALTAHLERLPVAVVTEEPWPTLPVSVTPWIGQTGLTPQELRSLEIGDVLLLPPSAPGTPLELILRQSGRPLAVARLHHRQLLIDRLVPTTMSEPS